MKGAGRTRVLVTGAAGFVGRSVIAALAERGHSVIALQHHTDLPQPIREKCEDVLSGDICDPRIQRSAVRDIDVVCHLAAYIPADFNDPADAEPCYRFNALATLGLASAAVEAGAKRFVYTSTGNMYSRADRIATESTAVYPTEVATYYFVSKLGGELYLARVCMGTAMQPLMLRLGTPYGPGGPEDTVIATFMRRASRGEVLHVQNGGVATYNFVFIEDIAYCVAGAVESGEAGIYNIASGELTSLRDLAEMMTRIHRGRKIQIHTEPRMVGASAGFTSMSIEKARRTWSFKPLNLLEGLRRYQVALADVPSR